VYEKEAVRRRRAVLAVLVVASLGLITFFFGDSVPGALRAIQSGVQVVVAPVENGASRVLKPVRDLAGWSGDVLDAKEDNERLAAELRTLRRELARTQTERRELEQLRSLAGLHRRSGFPDGTTPVTARVIARSPTVWYSKVRVDRGTADGIRLDQPVITGDGLVGKVTQAAGGSATVTLMTDQASSVSAQVMPGGTGGVVKPEVGKPHDLLLDFVERGRKIERGDMVLTAGSTSSKLESLFPRGIPIGRVRRVDSNELELYQRVHVEPFADMRRMDFVQVLTEPRGAQTTAVSAP
jgi:rod shape-determining protein MreC